MFAFIFYLLIFYPLTLKNLYIFLVYLKSNVISTVEGKKLNPYETVMLSLVLLLGSFVVISLTNFLIEYNIMMWIIVIMTNLTLLPFGELKQCLKNYRIPSIFLRVLLSSWITMAITFGFDSSLALFKHWTMYSCFFLWVSSRTILEHNRYLLFAIPYVIEK